MIDVAEETLIRSLRAKFQKVSELEGLDGEVLEKLVRILLDNQFAETRKSATDRIETLLKKAIAQEE